MELTATPWEHGRFDAKAGQKKVLFGRMYEDASIETGAFRSGGRVFTIASAGCTAIALAKGREVVAVDINPVQLAYAHQRLQGAPAVRGTAERVMGFARGFGPLVGWTAASLRAFLELGDPAEQVAYWRRHLDTARFRFAFDSLLSVLALRAVYAPRFLAFLPPKLGAVLRGRLLRCFERHPNRDNPYARALLAGELSSSPVPPEAGGVQLVCSDAAGYLEGQPAQSFDGFTLSNILDGADPSYRARLFAAVRRAARPEAMVVLRTFGEPKEPLATNRAADDRSLLWGVVDVRPARDLPE